MSLDLDPVETRAGARDRSFDALYRHWERHQWSSLQVDYTVDAASFRRLDERAQDDLLSMFAHFAYGLDPVTVWAEVQRQLGPWLRAIGLEAL